ncbi:MAG: peptide transporter [Clostridiaceae bacterium]|nr:peptide transporter [Clostridiaceae bacterium]
MIDAHEKGNTLEKERSFAGIPQLSVRSLIIGILGSCLITASSMYTALRMSALPWPTIFVSVLSMALLKILGKTTFNEINIAKTAMSAGAMISGGLAFTLPGLWITGEWSIQGAAGQYFLKVLAIALAGMLLGTVLTWLLRKRFIEVEALPYPIGTAAAETIKAGESVGKKSGILFGTMAFSALFTYFRDSLRWIPDAIVSKWLYARNFLVGIWVSPMAVGIGYLIGPLYTGVWFLGAVLSYLLIIPLGTALNFFATVEEATAFKSTAGIGLMVGTGAGIPISYIIYGINRILSKNKQKENIQKTQIDPRSSHRGNRGKITSKILVILPVVISFVLTVACGLGVIPSILLIIGVFLTSAMAATITGQTGIDPMEIFGIIVLLAIRAFVNIDATSAFFIAACVAISCGYTGDLFNDYKSGHILGSNPSAQLVSQVAGGIVGTVVAAASMFAVINQFGGVGAEKGLPAAQAFAVSQMVKGIGNPQVFWAAIVIGILLYLFKVPAMTLGIGMYLPFEISSVVLLGGLVRFITDMFRRRLAPGETAKNDETGSIAASGLLGGEGITGVAIAIIKMITGG